MIEARVSRVVPREGRPCHERARARRDREATERAVREALSLPGDAVKAKAARLPEFTVERETPVVLYAFSIAVAGRDWTGSGAPPDAELLNPANWREA